MMLSKARVFFHDKVFNGVKIIARKAGACPCGAPRNIKLDQSKNNLLGTNALTYWEKQYWKSSKFETKTEAIKFVLKLAFNDEAKNKINMNNFAYFLSYFLLTHLRLKFRWNLKFKILHF